MAELMEAMHLFRLPNRNALTSPLSLPRVVASEKVANTNGKGSVVITGWELIRRQFLALFIKRFHHARRSRKGLVAQVTPSDRNAARGALPSYTTVPRRSIHFQCSSFMSPWSR